MTMPCRQSGKGDEEGKVSVDLGFARGERIEEVMGDQATNIEAKRQ
jgi:hypothetical protein